MRTIHVLPRNCPPLCAVSFSVMQFSLFLSFFAISCTIVHSFPLFLFAFLWPECVAQLLPFWWFSVPSHAMIPPGCTASSFLFFSESHLHCPCSVIHCFAVWASVCVFSVFFLFLFLHCFIRSHNSHFFCMEFLLSTQPS